MEIMQAIATHKSLRLQVERRLRTLGLSWTGLSREVGLSSARLKSVLSGARMDHDLYERLCRALGWIPRTSQRRSAARRFRLDRRRTFFPNLMNLFEPKAPRDKPQVSSSKVKQMLLGSSNAEMGTGTSSVRYL